MTSIMLAKAQIKGRPLYLVSDEENRLYLVADNGSALPIIDHPVSLVVACELAERFFNLSASSTVHWIFDVHKRKLECLAREKGEDRDRVYKVLLADAMVREAQREIKTHDDLKRRVYMEVRFLPQLIDDPSPADSAEIISDLQNIGQLTPQEMAQLFPAEKRYDGGDSFKDFYSSIEFLNSLKDEPMGAEGALKFLWDFMNPQLMKFNLLLMKCIDADRKRQGKSSMGEQFAKEMGIPLYTKAVDEGGNPVLMDEEGNTIPLTEVDTN